MEHFKIDVGYDIDNHIPVDVLPNCREQISSRDSVVDIDSLTRYEGLIVGQVEVDVAYKADKHAQDQSVVPHYYVQLNE